MKRRDFIKTSAVAVGLAGTLKSLPSLAQDANSSQGSSSPQTDNRSPDYLRRGRSEPFLPQKPAAARAYPISPMPLEERIRRRIVPARGFCSIEPGDLVSEALTCGNGAMNIELMGDPYAERILFHHENLLLPWKKHMEEPNIAEIFPQVRELVLNGRHREALMLVAQRMSQGPIKPNTEPHRTIPAFLMQLDLPKTAAVRNYLRTVDFENSELQITSTDERGEWVRRTLSSRPDNVIVQSLTAPAGQTVSVRISLEKSAEWHMGSGATGSTHPAKGVIKGPEVCEVHQDLDPQRLIYTCRMDPTVDNSGYVGVTRVVRTGGSSRVDQNALVIENATSVLLLTRIEHFPELSNDKVEALRQAVEQVSPDYAALLERHRKVQAEMLNRVMVDFGGASQYGMSIEELFADQRSRPDYSPALLEKIFEMGRHWFIFTSGKYPDIPAETPFTVNHQTPGMEPGDQRRGEEVQPAGLGLMQTAGAAAGDLREGAAAYFNWIESLAADCRANAKNIFGFSGMSYPHWPQRGMGVKYYYSNATAVGSLWPYWISGGGIAYRPFWDHYLATGDQDFLRNRVVPAYKELTAFYEDFLKPTDKDGNYIFAPSFSPEHVPTSTDAAGPVLVNSTMDIAVCREVLTNLVQACQVLGIDADSVSRWKAMLAKMPPYLLEPDGTLKEWAWPALQEQYSHRNISHLYGVWPGDEIDPDRTPQLAKAAMIANRRRTFDLLSSTVSGESLPAFFRCHRALVAARLKDHITVDTQLRQLIEQGYVSTTLRCSRDPYAAPVPDAQTGIPAIIMEMLAYSRPGVIELLPALPTSLARGSISGMRLRTFARLDQLAWDLEAGAVDLRVTSARTQDMTLMLRLGIDQISAPSGVLAADIRPGMADCALRLPENKPVQIHLKLSRRRPMGWADQIAL